MSEKHFIYFFKTLISYAQIFALEQCSKNVDRNYFKHFSKTAKCRAQDTYSITQWSYFHWHSFFFNSPKIIILGEYFIRRKQNANRINSIERTLMNTMKTGHYKNFLSCQFNSKHTWIVTNQDNIFFLLRNNQNKLPKNNT